LRILTGLICETPFALGILVELFFWSRLLGRDQKKAGTGARPRVVQFGIVLKGESKLNYTGERPKNLNYSSGIPLHFFITLESTNIIKITITKFK
jgi:hypothetical protein